MTTARIAFALLASVAFTGSAIADSVRLSTIDDGIVVEGEIRSFDGEFYEIETIYGTLTFDASVMTCDGSACPDVAGYVPEVRISGAEDMGEILVPALIEAFAERQGLIAQRRITDDRVFDYALLAGEAAVPAIRFRFSLSTTEEGFADLLAGEADLVLATREISDVERERLLDAGIGTPEAPAIGRVIALDGLVPIVSMSNALDEIELEHLARIVTGDLANWADLGGPEQPIAIHLPDMTSGVAQALADRLTGNATPPVPAQTVRHDSSASLSDAVAVDPFAIGVVPYSAVGNAKALALTGPCGFPSRASPLALKTEDYPLTTPLFVYLPDRRLPKLARGFLSFANSSASALVVRRAGYVDQRPETVSLAGQGLRLANAIREAGGGVGLRELKTLVDEFFEAERLSVTFRFKDGSTELDAQSVSNIGLLAAELETGLYDDRTLIFAGFSDGRGDSGQNRILSERRAQAVRDAVLSEAPGLDATRVGLEVSGFGEALPMACDEVSWGQRINRRVEIWVR